MQGTKAECVSNASERCSSFERSNSCNVPFRLARWRRNATLDQKFRDSSETCAVEVVCEDFCLSILQFPSVNDTSPDSNAVGARDR